MRASQKTDMPFRPLGQDAAPTCPETEICTDSKAVPVELRLLPQFIYASLRYVARASRRRVLAASRCHFCQQSKGETSAAGCKSGFVHGERVRLARPVWRLAKHIPLFVIESEVVKPAKLNPEIIIPNSGLDPLRLDWPDPRWQNQKCPSLFLLPGGEGQDEGEPNN
jgi:hypothetical protein